MDGGISAQDDGAFLKNCPVGFAHPINLDGGRQTFATFTGTSPNGCGVQSMTSQPGSRVVLSKIQDSLISFVFYTEAALEGFFSSHVLL